MSPTILLFSLLRRAVLKRQDVWGLWKAPRLSRMYTQSVKNPMLVLLQLLPQAQRIQVSPWNITSSVELEWLQLLLITECGCNARIDPRDGWYMHVNKPSSTGLACLPSVLKTLTSFDPTQTIPEGVL